MILRILKSHVCRNVPGERSVHTIHISDAIVERLVTPTTNRIIPCYQLVSKMLQSDDDNNVNILVLAQKYDSSLPGECIC